MDDKIDKGSKISKILRALKKVKEESCSVEQAEKIVNILLSEDFRKTLNGQNDRYTNYAIIGYKKMAVSKLVEAVKKKMELTNDIQELKVLKEKLPYDVQQINPISVSPLKIKIDAKISKIKTDRVIYNLENNFSDNVMNIVKNISSKDINICTINKFVDNEISRIMRNKQ